MNRIIKFKAWDGKKMSKPFYLDDAAYEGFPQPVVDENGERRTGADIIWLQWTGLTDKQGSHIYEGDIINAPGHCGIAEVVFDQPYNGAFCVKNMLVGVIDYLDIEVIGNVWQTPELLK